MSGFVREEKKMREEHKQKTGSPQLQFWYSRLEEGYDHVQFERTHPRPADTDIMALKHKNTGAEAVNLCLYESQLCTLWPSFLIPSTAWLSRLKMFFFILCLPGGYN